MTAPAIVPPAKSVAKKAVDQPNWTAFSPAFFNAVKAEVTGPRRNLTLLASKRSAN